MSALFAAFVLGMVEGLTEYLPVSSTGHLILAGWLLRFDHLVGKDVAQMFEIFIQLGAILAVVAAYPRRFVGLWPRRQATGFAGPRGLAFLVLATLPAALVGLAFHKRIKAELFHPLMVAAGLAAGALWILLLEAWKARRKSPWRCDAVDALRWSDALAIGLFQCLALWPGMSRSSSTILGAMMIGVERKAATEFSFFAAVPLLAAAAIFDLLKSLPLLRAEHVPLLAVGLGVSGAVAFLAVKLFMRFLSRHTLVAFGWYRLAVAAVVAAAWWGLRPAA